MMETTQPVPVPPKAKRPAPKPRADRPRKYGPGRLITSMGDLGQHLNAGGWVWTNGRAWHPDMVRQMRPGHVRAMVDHGEYRTAELTPEWLARNVLDLATVPRVTEEPKPAPPKPVLPNDVPPTDLGSGPDYGFLAFLCIVGGFVLIVAILALAGVLA